MNEKSLKLLEQYEIEVLSTRRGRGSYICETNHGKLLFTGCGSSEKKMAFVNRLLETMKNGGYRFTDIAHPNKEGNLLTADRDEGNCVLKDWYEGRECDAKSFTDIEQALRRIARLHGLMYLPPDEENGGCSYLGEDLQSEMERHNRELRKVYSFMRRRRQKNSFEILFLNCFQMFYEQAQEAQTQLSGSGYQALRKEAVARGSICHGNFNYHNVWFVGKGQVFISNFERCRYDVQTADLYHLLRKIMEKQDWSKYMGHRMISVYDHERAMTKAEQDYLRIRLRYPEKFWKLANQYYNHNKAWVPEKNVEKLQTLIQQQNHRNSFLKTLE